MSAEHFSGIRHRRGGVVVIGVVTAVTTALQAPTAAAQSPEAPLDLTCTVTSPGLPAALAVPDVPATLERRPDPREGDATDMGPAPTDPVDSRGELTLRLPAGLGDLLAAHLPGARPSPEGLRINVDIAAEGEATGGEAGGRAAVGDTREVRLAMPGDSAVEPTPALATLAADFTCRVIEEVAPVTPAGPAGFTGPAGVAGPAGFAGPAAPGEPLAELRSEPSSGQLNPAAYQAGGADSVTSLSSGSGAATPHAPGGQAPTGQQQTVVTPGEASRATQTSGAGTTTSRSATSTSNSGGTGAGGASTTRSTAADRSATSTSTTSRSTAAASAATSATGTSAAAAGSVQQASGSAAGGAAYTVAGAQLLASNSSSSLSSEGDSEFGFHVSLSALLWATGGIIVLSLLYALWTSIRLRRLKAMTADQQLEG